jgi:hypothetical protein
MLRKMGHNNKQPKMRELHLRRNNWRLYGQVGVIQSLWIADFRGGTQGTGDYQILLLPDHEGNSAGFILLEIRMPSSEAARSLPEWLAGKLGMVMANHVPC